MMDEKKEKRICILGTAPTWRDAPFDDPSVEMWCLNDMWVLNPPRADRWFDLHPLDHMHFAQRGKKVISTDVPAGYFVRPAGHLEWLRQQSIPVYVQDAAALGSRSAVTFPKDAVEKAVGPHFASSPAWMLGLALLEGVTELHIFGIHLATEWEYLKQKPNLAFLLGLAAGKGVRIVLPKAAPLLRETHQYAYQPDPDIPKVVIQKRMEHLKGQKALLIKQEQHRRWWQRKNPNLASRLSWLDAQLMDAQLELQSVIAGRSPVGV